MKHCSNYPFSYVIIQNRFLNKYKLLLVFSPKTICSRTFLFSLSSIINVWLKVDLTVCLPSFLYLFIFGLLYDVFLILVCLVVSIYSSLLSLNIFLPFLERKLFPKNFYRQKIIIIVITFIWLILSLLLLTINFSIIIVFRRIVFCFIFLLLFIQTLPTVNRIFVYLSNQSDYTLYIYNKNVYTFTNIGNV